MTEAAKGIGPYTYKLSQADYDMEMEGQGVTYTEDAAKICGYSNQQYTYAYTLPAVLSSVAAASGTRSEKLKLSRTIDESLVGAHTITVVTTVTVPE